MKNRFKGTLVTFALSALISTGSYAATGGEKVNCRQVKDKDQNIYQGTASCQATYHYTTCPDGVGSCEVKQGSTTLSQSFSPTTQEQVVLKGLTSQQTIGVTGTVLNQTYHVECLARIPFSHTEEVTKEVCDLTPIVYITSATANRGQSEALTTITVRASDADGFVASVELWVDGVKRSGASESIITQRRALISVRAVVTDNDGHKTEINQTVRAYDKSTDRT